MRRYLVLLAAVVVTRGAVAQPYIIRDGKPDAEIVVAPQRPRMVTLAALDALLEDYYTRFYGPVREAMKEALTYAEVAPSYRLKDIKKREEG